MGRRRSFHLIPPRFRPVRSAVMPQEERNRTLTVSTVIVAVVAVGVAFFLGRELFQPIAIAGLLAVVFRPVVRTLERFRVPTPLAGGVVVLALIGGCVGAGDGLADPGQNWVRNAPPGVEAGEGEAGRDLPPT